MLAMLLRDELVAVGDLLQLLHREYAVLKARDLDGLEQIVRDKQVCAGDLLNRTGGRLAYLREQGFSADREGMAACLDTVPPVKRIDLQRLWAELQGLAEQVLAQNEINGAVIAASRNHVERALAVLGGRGSLDFLYDQQTRKVFGGPGQPIAKA